MGNIEDFLNKIINGNCIDILREFPDNSIDLTLTSPPYDQLRDYKGYEFKFESIAKQLFRVTKDGGVVVWVVGDSSIDNNETGTSFRQALYFKDVGFKLHDTMIYQKNWSAFPSKNRYNQVFEYMFVLVKGNLKTCNLIKDHKKVWIGRHFGPNTDRQKDGSLKQVGYIDTEPGYSIRSNVWKYKTGKHFTTKDEIAFKHPATFPEDLARDHIYSWSNDGDIILDPMCGSGTTCKMAHLLNRKWIGIEISQEYCSIAEQRIKPYINQGVMF